MVQLNKPLNNYDVGQSFLMKCRALQGGTNFNPLGYHGGNQAVQLNGGCALFHVKLNGADAGESVQIRVGIRGRAQGSQ